MKSLSRNFYPWLGETSRFRIHIHSGFFSSAICILILYIVIQMAYYSGVERNNLTANQENKMNNRATLSVGLNQKYADCELRAKFLPWLEAQAPVNPQAKDAAMHIYALEELMDAEKYATLSVMANDMRDHLAEIRLGNSDDFNRGYQRAINLVMDKLEDIDIDSQAATSIMEIQTETVRDAQTLCKNTDDYQAIGNYAKAIEDSAQ